MPIDGRLRNELSRDASDVDVDVDRFLESVVTKGKRRRQLRRAGGAIVVTLVLAVGAALSPTVLDVIRHQQRVPAAPVPTVAIEGTYVVRIQPADVAGTPGPRLEGLWQFTVRGDGLLSVTGPAGTNVSAPRSQYQLEGDRILTTAFASNRCSGVGVYRWHREGTTLTFTLVSDACVLRVVLFTAHPWEAR